MAVGAEEEVGAVGVEMVEAGKTIRPIRTHPPQKPEPETTFHHSGRT